MLYNKLCGDRMEYRSQEELYQGLIPALDVKVRFIKRRYFLNIQRKDIWNYLKENKWKNSLDLTLGDMVHDIIHTDNDMIIRYVKERQEDKL